MQDPRSKNSSPYDWLDLEQQSHDDKQNAATSPDASRKRLSLDSLPRAAGAIASISPNTLTADRSGTHSREDLPVQIQPWPSELTKANMISANKFVRTENKMRPYTPDAGNDISSRSIAYSAWGLDEAEEENVEKSRAFREMHEAEATVPVQDYVALIRQTEALSGPTQTPYTEELLLKDGEIAFTKPPEKVAPPEPAPAVEVAAVKAPEKVVVAEPEKRVSPESIVKGLDIKNELQKFKGDGVAFVKTIDPSGLRIQVQTAKDFSTLTETWMPGDNGKYFYNMELQDHLKRKVHEESVNLMGARTVVQTIYDSNSNRVMHKVMTKPDGTLQFVDA